MKILMVLERDFPPDLRVEHEIKSLITAGHQVCLASYTHKKAPAQEEWNGAVICRKPISKFIYKTSVGCLKFPFYFNFWRSFLHILCEKHQFDAVHIHDLPLARLGVELRESYGLRFILDLHENWPALLSISTHVQGPLGRFLSSDKQWRSYERKMIQEADDVIVVVEESKERIQKFEDNHSKIHVVSNTPVISELKIPEQARSGGHEEMILFYGGGINKHRGLQNIIRALSGLKESHIKCWIVGDGSYLPELKKLSHQYKVDKKVTFWGWKTLDEMTRLMLESDVLLIPHKKTEHTDTTIPHKLFQYMLTNKPILATNCAPIERIINKTKSGFIYQHDDIDSILKQVNFLYDKWVQGEELKMNGSKYIHEYYNWSVDKDALLNIYTWET